MVSIFDPGVDDTSDQLELELARFQGIIAAGTCPRCGGSLDKQETMEGWLYARPCGHRLGLAPVDVDADFGWSEPAYE